MPLGKLLKKLVKSKRAAKKKSRTTSKKKTTKKIKKKPVRKLKKRPLAKATKKTAAKKIKEEQIGVITHHFGKISVGIIKLKKPLRLGDKIHIKGAHDDFTQVVSSMQYNHKDISSAKKGLEVGIRVPQPVHENDRVYKVAK